MFDPAFQPKAATPWQPRELLTPRETPQAEFQAMDWSALPRVDYRSTHFRQLAVAEPAQVVPATDEFLPENYGEASASDCAVAEAPLGNLPAPEASPCADLAEPTPQEAPSEHDAGNQANADLGEAQWDTPLAEHAVAAESELPDAVLPLTDLDSDLAVAEPEEEVGAEPSAAAILSEEMIASVREAAFQEGLAAGRDEMQLQMQEALAQATLAAEAEKSEALEAQNAEMQQRINDETALLREVAQKLEACFQDSAQFFEPLKRLSMHIAEQLVLAELNTSGAAIERLVQRCLDELNLHGTQPVIVELSPQDKSRLQEVAKDTLGKIELRSLPSLQPGSVRVIVNETQVDDLIQTRLESMARSLLSQPEAWREKSPFFRQPLAHRDAEIQDAVQRPLVPQLDEGSVLDA